MRVAAFAELIGPDGVEVLERDDPEPGPGEVIVDVAAASLNRHDLWVLSGRSSMVDEPLPFVSGLDLAGTVSAAGQDVDDVAVGDRVVLCPNRTCGTCRFCREGPENRCASLSLFHGAFAERAAVDATRLIHLPDDVGFAAAAALPTAYLTAWHMLGRADVGAGDLVFVPGATGGVGVAAVQLLDLVGARSIGTSTSARKLDRIAALGCDHTVETADPEEMTAAVGAIGEPEAVLNHLAGEYVRVGLDVMARAGTQVVCGRTAGPRIAFEAGSFFLDQQTLVGSSMGTQPELETLVGLVADGRLDPVVDETYRLDETARAFADLQARDALGKLVVTP